MRNFWFESMQSHKTGSGELLASKYLPLFFFFLSFFFLVWTKGQLTNARNKSVVQLDVAQAASPWLRQQSNSKEVLLTFHYWIQSQPDRTPTECFPDLVDFISHIRLGETLRKNVLTGGGLSKTGQVCPLHAFKLRPLRFPLCHYKSQWFCGILIRLMRVFICCLITLVLISCFTAAMRGWNAMSDKWKRLVIELDERLGGNSIPRFHYCVSTALTPAPDEVNNTRSIPSNLK